jgi:hypothetical protein
MSCKAPDDSNITVYNSLGAGTGHDVLRIVVSDSVIEEI